MSVMGRASWDEWVSEYAKSHQHPINRVTHTLGIPMIALSIIGAPFAFVVPGLWALLVTLFVFGWIFQFIGHAFEGKPPEFLKDPRFLFVGLRWWIAKMKGKA